MDNQKAIEILEKRLAETGDLANSCVDSRLFKKWNSDTIVAIKNIFGEESHRFKEFNAVDFFGFGVPKNYIDGIIEAEALLSSMIDEINDYGLTEENNSDSAKNSIVIITDLCNRFNNVVKQLRQRHDGRATLDVADEYDVQDLFHALLMLYFDDIRPEDYMPGNAGNSSRIDFILERDEIGIELKMTRNSLGTKEVKEQLIIDIANYKKHPKCKHLICFVYDPDGRIKNPRGFEKDLSQAGEHPVIVYVRP